MTPIKLLCASILMLGAFSSGSAAAHGVRFGFSFGFPVYPPVWYYPAPAYYYPPPVAAAPTGAIYVERSENQAPSQPSENYWYFCPDSQTYYPYVQQCASAWHRVSPRPADVK
jgi:hypothetical protein